MEAILGEKNIPWHYRESAVENKANLVSIVTYAQKVKTEIKRDDSLFYLNIFKLYWRVQRFNG